MARKTTEQRVHKAVEAFVKSEEAQQTDEQKRENAWFPMHIKSIMENKDNICHENGLKTGESIVKTFKFTTSDAWHFAKGLKLFYSGVINAIERIEAEPRIDETKPEAVE